MDEKTIEQKLDELNREFNQKHLDLVREYVARLAALGLTAKDHVIVPLARKGSRERVFHLFRDCGPTFSLN